MDQIWIYVIIGIIYAISRALKKPENQPKDIGEQRPGRPVSYDDRPTSGDRPKPMTFEDLLKEITEAKQPSRPQPTEMPRRHVEVIDYDDDLKEEAQDLEEVDYPKKAPERLKSYEEYESAKRQAFFRPSLEETMKLEDTQMQFGKFKEFEQIQQRDLLKEYTSEFKTAEGLKKAFVLSEILNRKF